MNQCSDKNSIRISQANSCTPSRSITRQHAGAGMMAALAVFALLGLVAGCTTDRVVQRTPFASSAPLAVDADLIHPRQDGAIVVSALPAARELPEPTALSTAVVAAGPAVPEAPGNIGNGTRSAATVPFAPAGQLAAITVRPEPVPVRAPVRLVVPSVAPEVAAREEKPAPVIARAEPTLDVAALKERLKNTSAIGLFTKIALKNQVDDLLAQFRSYHGGDHKVGLAALREPYNTLVGKVLLLVAEGDPPLARTISGSREAIWAILADPLKFKSAA
jgi:hypothetical protein